MSMPLPRGTVVRVRTTNGGELVRPLLENYRPTYGIVLADGSKQSDYIIIDALRIRDVTPV